MKLIIFLCFLTQTLTFGQECSPGEFPCPGSERCIPEAWVCDGFQDCDDGEDEMNCSCDGFQCFDGTCIPENWECDSHADCSEGEDELNCPCFQCEDGPCIPEQWVCNNYLDCPLGDDEDEAGCPCDGFRCKNGLCIQENSVCDGQNDCIDWSDESEELCPCADGEVRCIMPPGSEFPGPCVPPDYICDEEGIWDCPTGSDEANCTKSLKFSASATMGLSQTRRNARKLPIRKRLNQIKHVEVGESQKAI